jgi:hypothetical protein
MFARVTLQNAQTAVRFAAIEVQAFDAAAAAPDARHASAITPFSRRLRGCCFCAYVRFAACTARRRFRALMPCPPQSCAAPIAACLIFASSGRYQISHADAGQQANVTSAYQMLASRLEPLAPPALYLRIYRLSFSLYVIYSRALQL